ncbi:MAG: phosphotransacetylase family protein [Planctomycetota bacterium]
MKVLHLVSEREYSGTSAVVIGLTLKLKKQFKLGYMKPLGFLPKKVNNSLVDADALFMRELLNLKESQETVCPVVITSQTYESALTGGKEELKKKITIAFNKICANKDLVIVEGAWNAKQGKFLGLSSEKIAQLFDSTVITVERFDESDLIDRIIESKEKFGEKLAGTILNIVPNHKIDEANNIRKYLKEYNIPILGVIPFLNILNSTSVEQLISHLHGKLLCAKEKTDNLVETVLVGAMSQEHSLSIFRKKKNFAVVTGGDRSDIHVAAINAGAKCLILSGGYEPEAVILSKAEEANIPVIFVDTDTFTTAENAEWLVAHARAHEPEKLNKLEEIISEHIDFPTIFKIIGKS